MKNIFIVLSTLFSCAVNAQDIGGNYVIKGDVKGLASDTAILSISGEPAGSKTDTALVTNGKFVFKGKIARSANAYLTTKKRRLGISLFLEPGILVVKGDLSLSDNISIRGTQDNNDLTELNAKESAAIADINPLKLKYKRAKEENDTIAMKALTARLDEAFERADKERQKIRLAFIKAHPTSLASAAALYVLQDDIPWQQLEELYQSLSVNVRNNGFLSGIHAKIAAEKRSDIGQVASDFVINDINGNPINLSSYKGKYVLLDFWASWCVPCRQENKNVLKVYNEYKNKNFTVLGISLDENAAKWKDAVIKDGLPWTNVSDLKANAGEAVRLYGVQPIPDNFLINPEGKIIGRKLFGNKLEQKLDEVLK